MKNVLLICCFVCTVFVVESCHTFNNTLVTATYRSGRKIRETIIGCLERKAFDDDGQNIKEVFIRNQNIPVIYTDTIRHLIHLKKLSIWSSSVREIQPRVFRNVPELEQVYMNQCNLTFLPNEVFNLVPSLVQLKFTNNRISSIQDGAFSGMSNLKRFNISYNELTEWNREWFRNSTELETIDFSHNKIKELPDGALEIFPKLKNIYFDYNDIKMIGKGAFNGLHFIQYLGLSKNGLMVLSPEAFSFATRINVLRVEANYISFVPEELFIRVNVSNMAMHGNPFNCYCFKKMIKWLGENNSKVIYSNDECNRADLPICVEPMVASDKQCSDPVGAAAIADFFRAFLYSQPPVHPDCFRIKQFR